MPITEEMYAIFAMDFGHRIKCQREALGLTQVELAKEIETSKTTIQNYEAGNIPKGLALLKISRVLKCSIDYLLIGEESPYIQQGWIPEIPSGMNAQEFAEYCKDKKSWFANETIDNDSPEVAELLEGARKVLTSGNPIAIDALERNIRYFSHAIEVEKRMQGMEADLAEMKSYIVEMKRQEEAREKLPKEGPSSEKKAA